MLQWILQIIKSGETNKISGMQMISKMNPQNHLNKYYLPGDCSEKLIFSIFADRKVVESTGFRVQFSEFKSRL